jgi:hypothetical protein
MRAFGKRDSDYLHKTWVTFENIQKSPDIQAVLAGYGFDANRIQEGQVKHNDARQSFRLLMEKRQSWKAAGERMKAKYSEVYDEYTSHVDRLRRELLEDPEAFAALDLEGKRRLDVSGFIEQVNLFFRRSIDDPVIAAKILPFGFTPELLQAGSDRLLEYQGLRVDFEKLYGECQKLKVEKDLAIRRLRVWMMALAAAARAAFAGNLQTLEEIGIFVRNSRKTAKVEEEPAATGADVPVDNTAGTDEPDSSGIM